jgi:hypothetical protein
MTPCDFASLKRPPWCTPYWLTTPKTRKRVAHHVWRIALGTDDDYHCVLCKRRKGDRYQ